MSSVRDVIGYDLMDDPIALRYHEVCKRADMSALPSSFFYLEGGDEALREDLVAGFDKAFRGSKNIVPDNHISIDGDVRTLIRECDVPALESGDPYKIIVVRNAQRLFGERTVEMVLSRLSRDQLNARLRIIMIGDRPGDEAYNFLVERKAYGLVTEPSHEKVGHWLAVRTLGRMSYQRIFGTPLIDPKNGIKLMERVGWSWAAALQAVKVIRTMTNAPMEWSRISALVPEKVGYGYSERLVFGKGRKGPLALAAGIPGVDVARTLGLINWHLERFALLRAIHADKLTDREAALEGGVMLWTYRDKYKPSYANYTNEKLRLRFTALDEARITVRSGTKIGVLEVLALRW